MDLAAIAETTVEMFYEVDKAAQKRNLGQLDPTIEAMMLQEAMALYMTQIINAKKFPPKPTADKPADNEHCCDCGRELSVGELQYLEGKTGDARQCYHCSHK